ncbi:MAG: hypothetical protein QM703_10185 [Gemmatales bacterium]
MAREPADRFASADEVAELLGRRLAELQSDRAVQQLPTPHRPWIALAGAAVLAIMALVGWQWWPTPKDGSASSSSTALPTADGAGGTQAG